MKTILALLLAQAVISVDSPLPPPIPLVSAAQGHAVVIALPPDQCVGTDLAVFGRTWRCRPDGRLILAIAPDAPLGSHDITTTNSTVIGRIRVTETRWPLVQRRADAKPAAPRRDEERAAIDAALASGPQRWPTYHIRAPFGDPLDRMTLTEQFGVIRQWTYRNGTTARDSHMGVDVSAVSGTPVTAVASGVVVYARTSSYEGNMAIVYHGDSVYSLVMHLSRFDVAEGAFVGTGQPLGTTGSTGKSTGPHLHFGLKINGIPIAPLDALALFSSSLP